MNNHSTVIIKKPWGHEYLAFKNNSVALWVLHIKKGERTSMHCHPSKTTGLIVVNGIAEINFIADKKILKSPDKQMIRRGLFHQTTALTDVIMFEFETPVDKDDLVRLKDNYGRKNSGYEGADCEIPKTTDTMWIDENVPQYFEFEESIVEVKQIKDISIFNDLDDNTIIAFLKGGLIKTIDDRIHYVTIPGDVGYAKVVRQVAKEMDKVDPDTTVMLINRK